MVTGDMSHDPTAPETTPKERVIVHTPDDEVGATDYDIGFALNEERNRQGLTTTELAKRVAPTDGKSRGQDHISQAQVSRLLTGKQGWRSGTLRAFVRALGIELVVSYR